MCIQVAIRYTSVWNSPHLFNFVLFSFISLLFVPLIQNMHGNIKETLPWYGSRDQTEAKNFIKCCSLSLHKIWQWNKLWNQFLSKHSLHKPRIIIHQKYSFNRYMIHMFPFKIENNCRFCSAMHTYIEIAITAFTGSGAINYELKSIIEQWNNFGIFFLALVFFVVLLIKFPYLHSKWCPLWIPIYIN